MRLLIIGPPGAGKGTHGSRIAARYGFPEISTGEIFRSHIRKQTPLGRQVQALIENGDFVPDEVTVAIVADRLAEQDVVGGFLLDGFPRTKAQAQALDDLLGEAGLDAVLVLDVPVDKVIERLLLRAQTEGRTDDNDETIRHRMTVYQEQTEPLLDHYTEQGLVVHVDGEGDIDEVSDRILTALEGVAKRS